MRAATSSSTWHAVLLQQNLPGASCCRPPELLQGILSPSTPQPPLRSAGSATVATRSGPKRMSQLALGEQVLAVDPSTGRLQFSPVYMWSSRRPAQASEYVTVHTDAGLNITGAAEEKGGLRATLHTGRPAAGLSICCLGGAGKVAVGWVADCCRPPACATTCSM